MIAQGLILMAAGMGTVALFLVLMVVTMQLVGVFFQKYADRFLPSMEGSSRDDSAVIAAAIAGIMAYRKR